MKKLLVVAQSLGGGGTEVAMTEFLNHLDSNLYDITLLLVDKNQEYKYRLKKHIKIDYIKFDNSFYKKLASTNSFAGKSLKKLGINKYIDLYKLIARHSSEVMDKYDVGIDFYGYGSFTTVYLALNVNAQRKAFWLHDQQMPWLRNVDKYFKYYDAVFGVSNAVRNSFNALYPTEASKCKILYNVINTEEIILKSKEFIPKEFIKNKFNIVTVGRLTEEKGYDIAIKSAKMLKEKSVSFNWFIIGDGRDRRKLAKMIKKYNLNDCVFLLGRRNNPYPYIKNCDLYVQPSRHEGYGLAVLEARVLKKAIVVSNLPAFKEQIVNGKNGVISELNAMDLCKNIIEMYSNEALRTKYSNFLSRIDFNDELDKFDRFSGLKSSNVTRNKRT